MTDIAATQISLPEADETPRGWGRRLSLPPALARWLAPALILVSWQATASLGLVSAALLPSPVAVLQAAWRLTRRGSGQRSPSS